MTFLRKLGSHLILTIIAVTIGVIVVVGDALVFGYLLGRPADFSDPDVLIINTVLTAIPFLILAYRGSRRLIPWLAGLGMTVGLWWHALQKGVAYQRAPDGSGVDMGLALLVLVSPAIIAVICVAIDEALRQRTVRD
jgi:hypothetical protein